MTWTEIRAHYAALHAQARAAGATQKAVAERGGTGQNSVSRLLTNDKLGPTVEVFVRAVEGLGKPVSQFFLELEQGAVGTLVESPAAVNAPSALVDRVQRIERTLDAIEALMSSSLPGHPALQAPPGHQEGRPSHGCCALFPGIVNHNHIATLDQQRVEAIVKASLEGLVATIARLDARVGELGERDAPLSAGPSTARTAHRRRARSST